MRIALSTLAFLIGATLPAAAQTPGPQAPGSEAAGVQKEVIDSAEANDSIAPSRPTPEAAAASLAARDSTDSAAAATVAQSGDLTLRNPNLARLDFSGTIQLKALYHDFASDRDADKRLSLQLRRFKMEFDGGFDPGFGFRGELKVEGNNRDFGVDNAYLYYTASDLVGFKGGKMKRPFSQEALQSSKSLYTIERGALYHDFLEKTTGYSYFDLGLMAYGGFEEDGRSLSYEVGVFNGKQSRNSSGNYAGQQDESLDEGFKAKDVVLRLSATPIRILKVEAAVSTKAAEDTGDPFIFDYAVNTAYQVGANLALSHLRLLAEAAWGDNHKGQDALILDGKVRFFTFYAMGVWREDYSRGRASELVAKMEGLDPDFEPGKGEGKPNDGLLRYTAGVNYFFTPRVSVLADYGVLQPITEVSGDDELSHDFEVLWRMSW